MYSDKDRDVMQKFIRRLILNPAFMNESGYEIEEHILLFFMQNTKALMATFSTSSYFPGLGWESVQELFLETLAEEINYKIEEKVRTLVRSMDFSFLNVLYGANFAGRDIQTPIINLLLNVSKKFEVRRAITPVVKIIENRIIDRYIEDATSKRSYIAIELEKVEKLRLQPNQISEYIKLQMFFGMIAFIRPSVDTFINFHAMITPPEVNFANSKVRKAHFTKLINTFSPAVSVLPKDIFSASLKMHESFLENESQPATGRLAKIFYSFGRNYKSNVKIDRGAETLASSWFHLQRRNYKYYGFDLKMLEELYRISAENYW